MQTFYNFRKSASVGHLLIVLYSRCEHTRGCFNKIIFKKLGQNIYAKNTCMLITVKNFVKWGQKLADFFKVKKLTLQTI